MLREGLAAEFPFAARALASLPRRFTVSREDPRWAAVSALGVAWLFAAAGTALSTLPRVAGLRDAASWLAGAISIAGAALAVAVAIRAGGRRGLLWYAVALAANALLLLVIELPYYIDTCVRIPGQDCSPVRLVLPHVFTLAGLLVSVVAVRFVATGPVGANPVLSAGGAVVLSQTILFVIYRIASPQSSDPVASLAIGLGLSAGTMLAAGAVLRRRAATRRSLIVFAVLVVLLWLGAQWPFMWDIVRGAYEVKSPVALYSVVVGPVELAALLLGWMLLLPGADERTRP